MTSNPELISFLRAGTKIGLVWGNRILRMVAYFVVVIKKSDKSVVAMFWLTGQTSCYTLLKTIVEKANFTFLAKKTSTDTSVFKQDAAQVLLAQKSDTSNLELPKKQRELCEVVNELVQKGLIQELMMGGTVKEKAS